MRLNNDAIKGLTIKELNDLGCVSVGVMPVRGIAKQRVGGLETTLKTDTEIHYENGNTRWELIKTKSVYYDCKGHEFYGYVLRKFVKESAVYDNFVQSLAVVYFVN